MMTVRKTSVFPASEKEVFRRLQKLKTLQYIAHPLASFTPVDGNNKLIWKAGSKSSYKFKLFRFIPFGIHTIKVIHFGLNNGILTHEGNKHVPVWNHKIIIIRIDGKRTKYTDIVDIDAGWKTPFVYFWAVCFYAHRQKRWINLLKHKRVHKKY